MGATDADSQTRFNSMPSRLCRPPPIPRPSPSRIHPVLGETPADDSMNASVPHRSPEPRFFFLPLLAIDRLWLRSRPRGACAALGFASCLSRQAGDCGFLSPSPCQARTQGLGELGARVWRTLLWASVSPPLSDHTSARQNGWDWRHGQRIGWWRAPQFLCGVELSLESRPPRLSCSSSPRTITHLHDPSLPQVSPAVWWSSVGGVGMLATSRRGRASRCGQGWFPAVAGSTAITGGLGYIGGLGQASFHQSVGTHLLLSFKRGPVRALELWKSPLALLSLSCLL